jgi:hypothetical protein
VVNSKAEEQGYGLEPRGRTDRRVRADVDPDDLLRAVASLSMPAHDGDPTHARRMVALLMDGLRYGASVPGQKSKKRHLGSVET